MPNAIAVVGKATPITVGEHNNHYTEEGTPIHSNNNLNASFSKGSPNVFINNRPILRKGDIGIEYCTCCGSNQNVTIVDGSNTVFVNSKNIAREGDIVKHHTGDLSSLQSDIFNIKIG